MSTWTITCMACGATYAGTDIDDDLDAWAKQHDRPIALERNDIEVVEVNWHAALPDGVTWKPNTEGDE